MIIFPAIDLFEGKAVRLFRGDYGQMTVYNDNPCAVAADFAAKGATHIHVVDLEGAKSGLLANKQTIQRLRESTNMFIEVGGGIRSLDAVNEYLSLGINRVIIGTAAVTDISFLAAAVASYGDGIAVGADIKDGYIAVDGWTRKSEFNAEDFIKTMQENGVKTVICTDISKDGAMRGTNRALYARLSRNYDVRLVASGGVSTLEDVKALSDMGIYGAIIGKAYYTGQIDLAKAIEVAKCLQNG